MRTSYPWQINSIVHKNEDVIKTFGMDAKLFSPKEDDELRVPAAPLEMHEGYSVFKGTLIEKNSSKTKYVTFNIPAKAVPYIYKKTALAIDSNFKKTVFTNSFGKLSAKLDHILDVISKVAKGDSKSVKTIDIEKTKAYQTKFISGTLKGKSPIDVLMESKTNKTVLLSQRKFLEDNLSKYRSNQTLIDAIDEAISLLESGSLDSDKDEVTTDSNIIILYESTPKNIKPLDEKGRYTIYQVSITYNPNMRMPVCVNVTNCFAPVDKTDGNKILMAEAVNKQTIKINLTEEEWFTMIDSMRSIKIMFENLTYPEQLNLADKISRKNISKEV